MIELMKYTYLMQPEMVEKELEKLWTRYQKLMDSKDEEDLAEARAILYLTGNIFCEQIAVGAIERRLHLLKEKLSLVEFLDLIDKESGRLKELREDELFAKLEKFYRVVKNYKNRHVGGKFYLDEEKFIEKYNVAQKTDLKIGYRGKFG